VQIICANPSVSARNGVPKIKRVVRGVVGLGLRVQSKSVPKSVPKFGTR